MRNLVYLVLCFCLLLVGCEGTKEEIPSNGKFIADQPIPIEYNGSTLYVHPFDNAEAATWGNYPSSQGVTGANSRTDGKENTRKIIDAFGEGEYAAYICDTLTAYGYDDWYLPSIDELNAIYSNSDKIIDLESENYWSSTETSIKRAWRKDFYDGEQDTLKKYFKRTVRCVRRD